MRKLVVFSILALFALAAATPLFAQSLGIEVLGVVKPPCLNGKTILLVRSPAGTIAEFLKESGALVSAPVLKLYHADFVEVVGPGTSKEALLAELSRPRKCVKSLPIPDTNGSENKAPSPDDTIGSEHKIASGRPGYAVVQDNFSGAATAQSVNIKTTTMGCLAERSVRFR